MKHLILFVTASLILFSCSDDELITSTTPNPGTCIISGNVKANLNEWPFFSIQIARGSKNHTLNPVAPIPRGEATPVRGFQFHQEFVKEW